MRVADTHHFLRRAKSHLCDTATIVCMRKICTFDTCNNFVHGSGLCAAHYSQRKRGGELKPARRYAPGDWGPWRPDTRGYMFRTRSTGIRNKPEYQKQHRYVMEQILGRPLLDSENIHHVNGDRADNRPENLELWSTSQPPGQEVTNKVSWALEMLRHYAPETLSELGLDTTYEPPLR